MSKNRVRTTISVDKEVLDRFRAMAEYSGMSLGRCIGYWLEDTADAAAIISNKLAESRGIPALFLGAISEMMDDQKIEIKQLEKILENGNYPPYSNTGVNSPEKGK